MLWWLCACSMACSADPLCPLVVQLAGPDMERAVAAEERRAFLLPHCKYACLHSFLTSLTRLHCSEALS